MGLTVLHSMNAISIICRNIRQALCGTLNENMPHITLLHYVRQWLCIVLALGAADGLSAVVIQSEPE